MSCGEKRIELWRKRGESYGDYLNKEKVTEVHEYY